MTIRLHETSISSILGDFIFKTDFECLPSNVIEEAKKCILDFLGVALAGSKHRFSKVVIDLLKSFRCKKETTIIGDGTKVSAADAALVNGVMGHILELDDGHRFAHAHPGTVVIPASLAVAERRRASGRDLIVAIVLGYEIMIRIASAINPSHVRRGFHTTGTCGTFGATVAAAKIMKMSKEQIVNAIGIAGIQGSGLLEVFEEPIVKPYQAGRAAQCGVYAALLAEKGVSGPKRIIEGNNGFCRATADTYMLERITENLGKNFEILRRYIKLHASCRHTHSAVDAALEIIKRNRLDLAEIEEVKVKTYSIAADLVGKLYEPKSAQEAKFSLPYTLAIAIREGKAGIRQFSEDRIFDPEVSELAHKVEVSADPVLDKEYPKIRPAIVTIFTKSGKEFTSRMDLPKGEPEVPVSDIELEDKYTDLATTAVSAEKAAKIISVIRHLEKIEDISTLTELLY